MSLSYRPEIDGLRALAVSAVLVFHAFPEVLPSGYLGVDVFFVLSGFLMTRTITAGLRTETFSFRDFFSRRVRRIFPALLPVSSLFLVLGWFFLFEDEFAGLRAAISAGSFFYSNWYALGHFSHYFAKESEIVPFLHLWSLSVEEQFYLLIPVILWGSHRLRLGLSRVLSLLTLLSLVYFVYAKFSHPLFAFFATPVRIWELTWGGVVALREQNKEHRELYSVLGAVILGTAIFLPPSWGQSPLPVFLAVASSGLLLAAAASAAVHRRIFSQPLLVALGRQSYSIYLWHLPLLSFSRIVYASPLPVSYRCLILLLTLILGYFSWRWIEGPARRSKFVWPWVFLLALIGALSGSQGFSSLDAPYPRAETPADPSPGLRPSQVTYSRWPRGRAPELVLIGDSHAEDKIHGIWKKDHWENWGFFIQSSCPVVTGIRDHYRPDCPRKMESFVRKVVSDPAVTTVLLAHHAMDIRRRYGSVENFKTGLRNVLTALEAHRKRVVFLLDVPRVEVNLSDCRRREELCRVPRIVFLREPGRQILRTLRGEFPGVTFFDPAPAFCDGGNCRLIRAGELLYSDSNHLSARGSEVYVEALLKTGLLEPLE